PSRLYLLSRSTAAARARLYPLSLHDALPISARWTAPVCCRRRESCLMLRAAITTARNGRRFGGLIPAAATFGNQPAKPPAIARRDRKSTRLNSSHLGISYAVLCLKKKKNRER